jgi:hypothetical protein
MLDPYATLELIQMAIDEGVPLRDLGRGIFRFSGGAGDALRSATTPSLAEAWHAELSEMMSDESREPPPPPSPDIEPPRGERDQALRALAEKWGGRDLTSRSAEHAEAAGDSEAAALRYVAAAEEASAIGGHDRAIELIRRAERLMSAEPKTDEERQKRLDVLLTKGRVLWRAAGTQPAYTLEAALAPLEKARASTDGGGDPLVRAEIGAHLARVAYDIGGDDHLRLAFDALHEAQQVLLDAGHPLSAARLLNEEAALLIRTGELAPAAELLARSRDVFLRHAEDSVDARRELAQTNHLVARLPLHGEPSTGDADAVAFAQECAESAAHVYQELGDTWEHSRTLETLGRLALAGGRPEEARALLRRAFAEQQKLGDAMGLARTTAALSELLADAGASAEALRVLNESIRLNIQLGSRQGIAYNLKGLDELERKATEPDVKGAISELRSRLEAAGTLH